MAAAVNVPVSVMENAGEGGAWGIALLGAYMANRADGESLDDFLHNKVFAGQKTNRIAPNPDDVAGFNSVMERYTNGLEIERAAVKHLK